MTTGLSFATSPADIRSIRRELDDLRRRVNLRPGDKPTAAPTLGLGYTPVNKAGDVMHGNLHFNTEGVGVIVDAQNFRRFGIVKYLGYNPTIVAAANTPFYLGHTNKATVDNVSSGFVFTPRLTVEANGSVTVRDYLTAGAYIATPLLRTSTIENPSSPGSIELGGAGLIFNGTTFAFGRIVVGSGNVLNAPVVEGGATGSGASLRSRYGSHVIGFAWEPGDLFRVYVDDVLVRTL